MLRAFSFLHAAAFACSWGPGAAAETPCAFEGELHAGVERVVDGETIALDDGSTLRLSGVLAPKAGHQSTQTNEAARVLEGLVAGRMLTLRFVGRRSDRYGRVTAQAFVRSADGGEDVWLQERLVGDGLARASALPGTSGCLKPLLAAERQARADGRGLWRDGRYRVHAADDTRALLKLTGTFALVAGRVAGVAVTRRTIFINFSADWRRDFTATLPGRIAEDDTELTAWIDGLRGREVQVRGWIERRNGPMIALGSADEIEILDETDAAQSKTPR